LALLHRGEGEKGELWGKECGINVWCSGEHIGKLRNIIGNMQGHTANMMRTQKLKNSIHTHPPPFPSSVPKEKR
jgi:hypothetical protein